MSIFLNSHFIFVALFLVSVVKPLNIPNSNRYIGMALMLVLLCLFLLVFFKKHNYKQIIKKNILVVIFIGLFLAINMLALINNLEKFNSYQQLIFFGFASMAVWCSFFMSWLIYNKNSFIQGEWLGWGLILILALVALWQIVDYSGSVVITQYFVSADNQVRNSGSISSITRWHTIYGVIAAISLLVALQKLLNDKNSLLIRVFFLFLIILLIYTGVLGQSRNFVFTLLVGLSFFIIKYLFIRPKIMLFIILFTVLMVHFILLNNSTVGQKYGQVFPYLAEIKKGHIPKSRDFIPQINNNSLTGRSILWKQGYQFWQKNYWLGIGPGSYRAINFKDIEQRNLHNYYFQVLVDTGIIGFSILLLLVFMLLLRAYQAGNIVILLAILSSLLFDNYLDYSFAWVFMMSWLLFVSSHSGVSKEKEVLN